MMNEWILNENGIRVRETDDGHRWTIGRSRRWGYLLSFDNEQVDHYREIDVAMRDAASRDECRSAS